MSEGRAEMRVWERALEFLSSLGFSKEEINEAVEWYFDTSIEWISKVSTEVCEDLDDAIAWDIHEMIEALMFKRHEKTKLNWKDKEEIKRKKPYHQIATRFEILYLKQVKRQDLIEKILEREAEE